MTAAPAHRPASSDRGPGAGRAVRPSDPAPAGGPGADPTVPPADPGPTGRTARADSPVVVGILLALFVLAIAVTAWRHPDGVVVSRDPGYAPMPVLLLLVPALAAMALTALLPRARRGGAERAARFRPARRDGGAAGPGPRLPAARAAAAHGRGLRAGEGRAVPAGPVGRARAVRPAQRRLADDPTTRGRRSGDRTARPRAGRALDRRPLLLGRPRELAAPRGPADRGDGDRDHRRSRRGSSSTAASCRPASRRCSARGPDCCSPRCCSASCTSSATGEGPGGRAPRR